MNLSDRDILAKTIMAEAGNQSQLGMLGVGSVIMNRLRNPGYGNTLQDVILKPGQFSPLEQLHGLRGRRAGSRHDEPTAKPNGLRGGGSDP